MAFELDNENSNAADQAEASTPPRHDAFSDAPDKVSQSDAARKRNQEALEKFLASPRRPPPPKATYAEMKLMDESSPRENPPRHVTTDFAETVSQAAFPEVVTPQAAVSQVTVPQAANPQVKAAPDVSQATDSRAAIPQPMVSQSAIPQTAAPQATDFSAVVTPDVSRASDATTTTASTRAANSGERGGIRKIPARVLTALLGIPIVLAIVWIGGALLTGVTVFLALVAMRELIVASRRSKTPLVIEWCYFLLLFAMISLWQTTPLWRKIAFGEYPEPFVGPPTPMLLLMWPFLMLLFVPMWLLLWAISRYEKNSVSLASVALSTLAIDYVALFAFLPMLRDAPDGLSLFSLLLAGVWAGDTAAYYVGRAFGEHHLTSLSPGKTSEGVLAGVFATVLVCSILAGALQLEWAHGIAIGMLISIFAPLGDLVESLWKRELGIKDSGSILPGHGGVLDRCDSLLLAAPAVFVYALWQNL